MKRPHPKNTFGGIPRFISKTNRHPTPKVTQPEASTLAEVRAYCDDQGIEHFHIPGWLLETFGKLFLLVTVVLEHARDSAEEVRGFPDLVLFYRGRFMAIELKTEIGAMTAAQRMWMRRMNPQAATHGPGSAPSSPRAAGDHLQDLRTSHSVPWGLPEL